ncbi:MAG: N-6 DNA methylase [Gammaproteobacteria bacterium]|nr:N-6 DNA methylase [Gammaproteobacteria bacterium]
MQPLDKTLRNQLERTIKNARDIAEAAARAALEQLGVREASAYSHLNESDRDLRRRLRVHGRQLGDHRKPNGEQAVGRLIEKVAYEHWHRMLFARFLAENNLLMYPDPDDPVAVTLEECEDLAADEGAANGWELAARFAAHMLPQIFRLDSPVFQLVLPPEYQQKLERLVAGLQPEVFTASDSLGWVYQFWQAKKKDEVNASEVKIGAHELPAVTQLFTEPYMVSFLLDNSLGAWWAAGRLTESDLQCASNEEELRQKASIPGVPLEYLRFVKQEAGAWAPVADAFEGWPEQLADLKALDPCCGSGHFLVAAFQMLVPMRMELDGLSAKEAVDAVLRENIHGLELDQRCVELAAFSLALAAWNYPNAGGYRVLSELNVACSGLSVSVAKDEWKQLAQGRHNLRIAMDWLHDTFKDAPVLGSLINPANTDAAKLVQWDELSNALERALKQEQSEEQQEVAVVAQGLAKAATLLAGQYHWVITNVPYLARGKQNEGLREFCGRHYSAAKNDLATVFLVRCLEFCIERGVASVVLPQNWLFQPRYKSLRENLLEKDTWRLIARLGPGAFETISGEVVQAILIIFSRSTPTKEAGGLFNNIEDGNLIRGVDVSEPRTTAEKAAQLLKAEIKSVEQAKQLENPDARVALEEDSGGNLLESDTIANQGIKTGDDYRWRQNFWERPAINNGWRFYQSTVDSLIHYGGRATIIDWRHKGIGMPCRRPTNQNVGTNGIAVSQMGQLPPTLYTGELYDSNVGPISPRYASHLPAIWCFCSSLEYNEVVRQIDQSLKVTNTTLVKVHFDLAHWTEVAAEKYPNGLPKPYTDDPTQWIFHGHPCGSVVWDENKKWTADGPLRTNGTVLHIAVARLLGYRWPAELDASMELADEQREWANRCEALANFVDYDGIVCIPPVRGESSATDRLLNLLAAAYGDAWSNDTLTKLLRSTNHAGKILETWLRENFFTQHCKLFQHRPFIWHIWDGLRDGFAALVNYHKLDAKLLETLIYTYLGDWISRQNQDIASGVDGAQERLAAAEALKKTLEMILEGEAPYDIFVRWKPLEKQTIGWNPDLNDGMRLNIRPFLTVPDVGKKGAGVLRDKPNIKWNKDRGKDVESAPWYHIFKGDRINEHHLTLAEKRAAQEATE